MPNPYPTALRARAVRAYEAGDEAYEAVAARFEVGVATAAAALARLIVFVRHRIMTSFSILVST